MYTRHLYALINSVMPFKCWVKLTEGAMNELHFFAGTSEDQIRRRYLAAHGGDLHPDGVGRQQHRMGGVAHHRRCPQICQRILLGGGELPILDVSGAAWSIQVFISNVSLV